MAITDDVIVKNITKNGIPPDVPVSCMDPRRVYYGTMASLNALSGLIFTKVLAGWAVG
jgi:hypothetical protein